jgi:hypothetical protein
MSCLVVRLDTLIVAVYRIPGTVIWVLNLLIMCDGWGALCCEKPYYLACLVLIFLYYMPAGLWLIYLDLVDGSNQPVSKLKQISRMLLLNRSTA